MHITQHKNPIRNTQNTKHISQYTIHNGQRTLYITQHSMHMMSDTNAACVFLLSVSKRKRTKHLLQLRHFFQNCRFFSFLSQNSGGQNYIFWLRPFCLLLGIGLGICRANLRMHLFFLTVLYSLDLTSHNSGSDLSTWMHSIIILPLFTDEPLATPAILLFTTHYTLNEYCAMLPTDETIF